MNIAEQLRTNLQKYREEACLTSSELARRSGVSRSYIWQIEHGESVPTVDIVEQLATGLDITIEMLLGLTGSPNRHRNGERQLQEDRIVEKVMQHLAQALRVYEWRDPQAE